MSNMPSSPSAPMPNPMPSPTPSGPPVIPLPPPDGYGCLPSAGYYFSPSQGACCRCSGCEDPQPWTCNANGLPATGSMTDHGCRAPGQIYDYQSGNCCSCECIAPIGNPNQS